MNTIFMHTILILLTATTGKQCNPENGILVDCLPSCIQNDETISAFIFFGNDRSLRCSNQCDQGQLIPLTQIEESNSTLLCRKQSKQYQSIIKLQATFTMLMLNLRTQLKLVLNITHLNHCRRQSIFQRDFNSMQLYIGIKIIIKRLSISVSNRSQQGIQFSFQNNFRPWNNSFTNQTKSEKRGINHFVCNFCNLTFEDLIFDNIFVTADFQSSKIQSKSMMEKLTQISFKNCVIKMSESLLYVNNFQSFISIFFESSTLIITNKNRRTLSNRLAYINVIDNQHDQKYSQLILNNLTVYSDMVSIDDKISTLILIKGVQNFTINSSRFNNMKIADQPFIHISGSDHNKLDSFFFTNNLIQRCEFYQPFISIEKYLSSTFRNNIFEQLWVPQQSLVFKSESLKLSFENNLIKEVSGHGLILSSKYGRTIKAQNSIFVNSNASFLKAQDCTYVRIENLTITNLFLNIEFIEILDSDSIQINKTSIKNSKISADTNFIKIRDSNNFQLNDVDTSIIELGNKASFFSFYNFLGQALMNQITLHHIYQLSSASSCIFNFNVKQGDYIKITNLVYTDSTSPLIALYGERNERQLKVQITNASISNIRLKGEQNHLIALAETKIQLSFNITNATFNSNYADDSSLFGIYHADKMKFADCKFQNNRGVLMIINPYYRTEESQIIIENSNFSQNSASTGALIKVIKDCTLHVKSSNFQDNYSLSRGGLFYVQGLNSNIKINESNMLRNSAFFGGVFFNENGGKIFVKNSFIKQNFAYIGGILYQLNDASSTITNSSITENFAFKAAVTFSLNNQMPTIFSSSYFNKNGMKTALNIDEQDMQSNLSLSFVQNRVAKLVNNLFLEKLMINYLNEISDLVSSEFFFQNYHIQIVSGSIILNGNTLFINSTFLLSLSSKSSGFFQECYHQGLLQNGPYIKVAETSSITMNNSTFDLFQMSSFPLIEMLFESNIYLINVTFVNNIGSIVYLKSSSGSAKDIQFRSTKMNSNSLLSLIDLFQSNFTIENTIIDKPEILSSLKFTSTLIKVIRSTLMINNLTISESQANHIVVQEHSNVFIKNSLFLKNWKPENISETIINSIKDYDSQFNYLNDDNHLNIMSSKSLFADINIGVIFVHQSSLSVINSQFKELQSNNGGAIQAVNSLKSTSFLQHKVKIQNCYFKLNKASINGGALFSIDYNINISDSVFAFNTAQGGQGGAIDIRCSTSNIKGCYTIIKNNKFQSNSVFSKGGAIAYNLYSPLGLLQNIYAQNQARYGPDYASFPFKVGFFKNINNSTINILNNITSGEKLKNDILVGLFDENNQIVGDDSSSELAIEVPPGVVIGGESRFIAKNGIFNVSRLMLIGEPGSKHPLILTSRSLDKKRIGIVQKQEFQGNRLSYSQNFIQTFLFLYNSEIVYLARLRGTNSVLSVRRVHIHFRRMTLLAKNVQQI